MWEEHLFKLRGLLKITVREVPGEAVRSTVLCSILPRSGSHFRFGVEKESCCTNQLCVREEGSCLCSAKQNEMYSTDIT